jgi:hypothetical protein
LERVGRRVVIALLEQGQPAVNLRVGVGEHPLRSLVRGPVELAAIIALEEAEAEKLALGAVTVPIPAGITVSPVHAVPVAGRLPAEVPVVGPFSLMLGQRALLR